MLAGGELDEVEALGQGHFGEAGEIDDIDAVLSVVVVKWVRPLHCGQVAILSVFLS